MVLLGDEVTDAEADLEYLDYDAKFSIIVPRAEWIIKVIVQYYHARGCHISRRRKAKVENRIMAPLLSVRLRKPLHAFTRVTVD